MCRALAPLRSPEDPTQRLEEKNMKQKNEVEVENKMEKRKGEKRREKKRRYLGRARRRMT